MDGIGPSSEAYESPVLPLNYTDIKFNIAFLTIKTNLKTDFASQNPSLKNQCCGGPIRTDISRL